MSSRRQVTVPPPAPPSPVPPPLLLVLTPLLLVFPPLPLLLPPPLLPASALFPLLLKQAGVRNAGSAARPSATAEIPKRTTV